LKKNSKEFPILIAQDGPLNGNRWVIQDEISIGRDPSCSVIFNDRQVSRFHAKIKFTDTEKVYLEDLGSKNGTFLNGETVTCPKLLSDGDLVKIALIQDFLFFKSDVTLPLSEKKRTKAGRLLIDRRARRVWVNEQEVIPPLSVQQYKLLLCLYEHEGEVLTRELIIQSVWGVEQNLGITEQALDALVRRLRDRLAEFDPIHNYLITVRGFGFRLENPLYEKE
jgi:pSer/pThr/pTyr-binding forkhead associated (FHA) protein